MRYKSEGDVSSWNRSSILAVVNRLAVMNLNITRFLWSSGDFGHSRKRLNAYNAWMILFVSIGSLCYGYTANVISATLGMCLLKGTF